MLSWRPWYAACDQGETRARDARLEKRLPHLITHLLIPLYPAAALFLLLCLHTTLSCK